MTIKLKAQPRTVTGKKVKTLRREGLVPAVVYGKDFDSLTIQVESTELSKALSDAGTTNLISLEVDGSKYDVLVKDIVRSIDRKSIVHTDLYHVNKNIAVKATVPVVVVGESPLIKTGGIAVNGATEVEVQCLPNDIPSEFQVDISGLEDFSQVITVADLEVDKKVEILTSESTTLAYIATTRASRMGEDEEGEETEEGASDDENAEAEGAEQASEEEE